MTPINDKFARRLPVYRLLAAGLIAITVIICSVQQLLRRDGDPELFVNIASLLLNGKDIYGVPSAHGNFFYYPPFFAVLNIVLIPLPVELLVFLWALLSVGLLGWSMAAFYSGMTGQPFLLIAAKTRWVVCFVTILLSCRFIISHLRYGQTNIFILALAVFGLSLLTKRRGLSAGIVIALSAAVKLTTLPFGFWFLARRNWKTMAGILAGGLLAFLLPALIVGFQKDLDYHKQWVQQVALPNTPGSGNWVGIGNVGLRAQAERFFSNVDAFQSEDELHSVTLVALTPEAVRIIGYVLMLGIALAIGVYAVRFRNAPELVSQWGGYAFVFSLIPNFTPISEIPHLVLLIPAQIYVVHLFFVQKLTDPLFRVLVVFSVIFTTLSTKTFFGEYLSRWLTAVGVICFGMLFLSAAIFRAGVCIQRSVDHPATETEAERPPQIGS